MDDPRITVIVTVKNGQKTIAGCLDSILACDYKDREIIVVDDRSSDKTPEILMSYSPRVKVITNEENRGPAASRNIAVAASTGEYLAFTDSDCLAEKNWLKELVSCFDDPAVAGAGGYQGIPGDETVSGRNIALFLNSIGFAAEYLRGSLSGPVVTSHNPSCNVLYKKKIFLKVEGFSPDLWTSEDVDLDYRLIKRGYKLMFNPRAIVYHYRQGGLKDFSGKMFRYGLAQGVLVRKYGFFRKVQYSFIASCVLLAVWLLIVFSDPGAGLFLLAGLLAALEIYFIFSSRKLYLSFLFLRLFLILMFSWNAGFFSGIIDPDPKRLKF